MLTLQLYCLLCVFSSSVSSNIVKIVLEDCKYSLSQDIKVHLEKVKQEMIASYMSNTRLLSSNQTVFAPKRVHCSASDELAGGSVNQV